MQLAPSGQLIEAAGAIGSQFLRVHQVACAYIIYMIMQSIALQMTDEDILQHLVQTVQIRNELYVAAIKAGIAQKVRQVDGVISPEIIEKVIFIMLIHSLEGFLIALLVGLAPHGRQVGGMGILFLQGRSHEGNGLL